MCLKMADVIVRDWLWRMLEGWMRICVWRNTGWWIKRWMLRDIQYKALVRSVMFFLAF